MPENCDAKTLSYVIVRHPLYNIYHIYHIYNTYIYTYINDICYILIIYINKI